MSGAHTPGPWKRRIVRGVPDGYIAGPDETLPGALYPRAVCKIAGRATLAEARANMALIEAAPDLLAACEHVVAFLSPDSMIDALEITMICNAVKKARRGTEPV